MKRAALILAMIVLASAPTRSGAETFKRIGADDPEYAAFGELADTFFRAVKARDTAKFRPLFERDVFIWFKDRMANTANPEYDLLYGAGSAGATFAKWQDFRWVVGRIAARSDHGQGALLCLADGHGAIAHWPPEGNELRTLEAAGTLFCDHTYRVDGRRYLSTGFLHPEEGFPIADTAPRK